MFFIIRLLHFLLYHLILIGGEENLGGVEIFWDQGWGDFFLYTEGGEIFVHILLSDIFNKCYKNTIFLKNNLILLFKI